jgi:hypothetical protein
MGRNVLLRLVRALPDPEVGTVAAPVGFQKSARRADLGVKLLRTRTR